MGGVCSSKPSDDDGIRHVVYLLLENRSFDQVLGCIPGVNGIKNGSPRRFNLDGQKRAYFQNPNASFVSQGDYPHEFPQVLSQMAVNVDNTAVPNALPNSGFVTSVERMDGENKVAKSETEKRSSEVMSYFPLGQLPVMHFLAREFGVCDRWFSSFPGSTWPNRFFALTGTSRGNTTTPTGLKGVYLPSQPTIFDALSERSIPWRIFYHDFATSLLLTKQWKPDKLARYGKMSEFFELTLGPANKFPSFCFLEPRYSGAKGSDQHPPHNMLEGDALVGQVYAALRSNESLWRSTLLVVTYDEHGGFYDHCVPPTAVSPDIYVADNGFQFDRLGVRVPTLLISPWINRSSVDSTLYDHTSLLKYLTDKWQLPVLTQRVALARHFGSRLRSKPRNDTPSAAVVAALIKHVEENKHLHQEEDVQEWNGLQKEAFAAFQSLATHDHLPSKITSSVDGVSIQKWSLFCELVDQNVQNAQKRPAKLDLSGA